MCFPYILFYTVSLTAVPVTKKAEERPSLWLHPVFINKLPLYPNLIKSGIRNHITMCGAPSQLFPNLGIRH